MIRTAPPMRPVGGYAAPMATMTALTAASMSVAYRAPPRHKPQCPHGQKVRGYSQRLSFHDDPRLIGPIQRGSPDWKILDAARTASERINSDDQAVMEKGRPPRLRGLQACRFSGAIRTLTQLLRRALNFVLDVTSTLGKLLPVKT